MCRPISHPKSIYHLISAFKALIKHSCFKHLPCLVTDFYQKQLLRETKQEMQQCQRLWVKQLQRDKAAMPEPVWLSQADLVSAFQDSKGIQDINIMRGTSN